MGDVEECIPPASVHLDGSALSVIGRLAPVAKRLAAALPNLSDGDDQRAFQDAIAMTEEVIGMLRAWDITFTRLEHRAERIIELLDDGEQTTFCNHGSDSYFISGVLAKRVRTVVVGIAGFSTKPPDNYANLKLKEDIILLRRGYLKSKSAMLRVSC